MGIGIEIRRTVWPGFQGSGGVSCVPFCHLSIRDIIITGYTLQRPESSDMESCCFWLPLITKVVFYGSNVFLRMGDSRGLLTPGGWGNKLKRRQRERWTILELAIQYIEESSGKGLGTVSQTESQTREIGYEAIYSRRRHITLHGVLKVKLHRPPHLQPNAPCE